MSILYLDHHTTLSRVVARIAEVGVCELVFGVEAVHVWRNLNVLRYGAAGMLYLRLIGRLHHLKYSFLFCLLHF